MTFCDEVRRETDICWIGSFEHPFILKLADGELPFESLKRYEDHIDEHRQHKLKELFTKSYLYERSLWEMTLTKKSWIPEGIK